MRTVKAAGVFADSCKHHFNQFSAGFLSPRRNPHPLVVTPASFSQRIATPHLLPVSTELLILDILYKWNQAMLALLCLSSLAQQCSRGPAMLKHASAPYSLYG